MPKLFGFRLLPACGGQRQVVDIRPDLGKFGLGEVNIEDVEKLRNASFLKDAGGDPS